MERLHLLAKSPNLLPEVRTAPPHSHIQRTWTLWCSGLSTSQLVHAPQCATSATMSSGNEHQKNCIYNRIYKSFSINICFKEYKSNKSAKSTQFTLFNFSVTLKNISRCMSIIEQFSWDPLLILTEALSLWPWACHGTLRNSTVLTATPPWQTMGLWRRRARCTARAAMSSTLLRPAPVATKKFWGWVAKLKGYCSLI